MIALRISLIVTTIIVWLYTMVETIDTMKIMIALGKYIQEHPKMIWLVFAISMLMWTLWICAFGWKVTIIVGVVGYALGMCRGFTVREEVCEMLFDDNIL